MAWKVAVVEDDPKLARAVVAGLRQAGHQVRHAVSARAGLEVVDDWHPDLVLLDLMLPDNDGPALFRRFRAKTDVPLVGMSARSMLADVVASLDFGADDYLTKPFALEELAARVSANLRRVKAGGAGVLKIADLEVDVAGGVARLAGQRLDLTGLEFRVLSVLARNRGRWVSKESLAAEVWSSEEKPRSNSLDVHITRLRKKLETGLAQVTLDSMRGLGYSLKEGSDD